MATKKKTTKKPNLDKNGFFTWTVEIKVAKFWVEDGFDLNKENIHAQLHRMIPQAYSHEVKARVISAPPKKAIRKAQGYDD